MLNHRLVWLYLKSYTPMDVDIQLNQLDERGGD